MRVCIVTHVFGRNDGQGRVNYEIVRHLPPEVKSVTLIAARVDEDLLRDPRIRWVRAGYGPWPSKLLKYIHFGFSSAFKARALRADIDALAVNGGITFARPDFNFSHFCHWSYLRSPVHPARSSRSVKNIYHLLYSFVMEKWERFAYRSTRKAIVAVSGQVRSDILEGHSPRAPIHVIANGVDFDEFALAGPAPESPQLRLLFVGDLRSDRKNLKTVLEAIVGIPDAVLTVVGDTANSRFPQLSKELGLESRVRFLGKRRDIPQLLAATDAFLLPSLYDPFALVVLEALAVGRPVILSRQTGSCPLINETNGTVVSDPRDLREMREAILGIRERKRAGGLAPERIRASISEMSWANVARRYWDLMTR